MISHDLQFLRKGDVIHYRIKNILYNSVRDCFELRLASCFKDCPEIRARVSYYHGNKVGFIMSETDDQNYHLVQSGREHVENTSKVITNILKKALEGVYGHEEDKKLKRISIF